MATRNLSVKYSTEGFAEAIASIKSVGQSFDDALNKSQQAVAEAVEAAKNASDPTEIKNAEDARVKAVRQANQAINNAYRELGVKQEADLRRQKEQAISAFEAIKKSGVASASDIARAEESLNRKLEQLEGQLGQVEKQARNTGGGFTVLKGAIAGIASGAVLSGVGALQNALTNLASNVFSAGTTTENLKAQLKTLKGSAEGAAKAYAEIAQFAKTTPYELEEVTQAYISLANRGIEPTNEMLTQLGDISSSQGKPLQQMVEAILDASNGANERLTEFGINASKSGDKVTFTFKGVSKTVNATATDITKALLSFGRLDGVLGGMNERAKTTEGQLSNLTDGLKGIYVQIFEAIKPALDAVIASATAIINPLNDQKGLFNDINAEARDFADYLKANPGIVKEIGNQLQNSVAVVMKSVTTTAKQLLEYLEANPKAIEETINKIGFLLDAMGKFLGLINKSIEGWQKIGQLISVATGRMGQQENLNFAQNNNVTQEEIRERFKQVHGLDPFAPGTGLALRLATFGKVDLQEAIAEITQQLVAERSTENRNKYGPPLPPQTPPANSPKPLPVPEKAVTSLPTTTTSSSSKSPKPLSAEQQFSAKTIAIAKELGIDPHALMTIMLFESAGTLSPKVQGVEVPGQGRGRGLIQFMPGTARGLGTSDAALASMTALQQLDWVKKYFAQFKGNFGAGKLENLYAAVLAGDPRKVNASDGYTTARQGAVTMMRNFGSKAASLLAGVPGGVDFSTQFEFDSSVASEAQRIAEEKRRAVEEGRRKEAEGRRQQQELKLQQLRDDNQQELLQFDAITAAITEKPRQAGRAILREDKAREQQYAEQLLELEQQINNLLVERQQKIEDIKGGYSTTNKDLTAELVALENKKKQLAENLELEKAIALAGKKQEIDRQSKELKEKIEGIDRTQTLLSTSTDTPQGREAIALLGLEEKYRGYTKQIEDTVEELKTLIEVKKALGLATDKESQVLNKLEGKYLVLNRLRDKERREIEQNTRFEARTEQLTNEEKILSYDAVIAEEKAKNFSNSGDIFKAARVRREQAISEENLRYKKELLELETIYKNQPKLLEELTQKAGQLNSINLSGIKQQFLALGEVQQQLYNSFANFITNAFTNFLDPNKDRAILEQRLAYAEELNNLNEQYKEEPSTLAEMKNRLRELNSEKLDSLNNEFNIFSRTVNFAKQALAEFLKSLAQMAAQNAARAIFTSVLKGIGGGSGIVVAESGATISNYDDGGRVIKNGRSLTGVIPGLSSAFNREGSKGVLAVFTPGEEILSIKTGEAGRYQALKKQFGVDPLGKILAFADGGTAGAIEGNLLSSLSPTNFSTNLNFYNRASSPDKSNKNYNNKTINMTVVTPNADSFRASEYQRNQDLIERFKRL